MLSLAIAVLLATAPEAPAERLHVEWVAPEGCPSRESLASSLETSVPANRSFHASVRIDEPNDPGGAWRAVVTTSADDKQYVRVVDGADCARVSDAAVLVVTLAATSLAPQAAPPPPAAQDAPPKAAAIEQGGGSAKPLSLTVRLQPEVGGHAGLFPNPGGSLGLAIATMRGPLRLQLALTDWLTIDSASARSVSGGLTSATVRGCWLFAPQGDWRLGPCAALEGGGVSVEGAGISAPKRNSVLWGAALAGVTASTSLTKSISPWVTAEAGVNLVRPRFMVVTPDGDVTVHRVGWVVGRLTLGVELEFTLL